MESKGHAADRFDELALMARKYPDEYEHVMALWDGRLASGRRKHNWAVVGLGNGNETQWPMLWQRMIGFLEIMKSNILQHYHGL